MSRLIDADKLIEDLEKVKKESESLVDISHIIGFQSVIDVQPTAFDVDKVVEQLEENADVISIPHNFSVNKKVVISLNDAIDIVKQGEIVEDKKAVSDEDIYNKAINDFIKRLEKLEQENWIDHLEYGITWDDIEEVKAELLKKRGEIVDTSSSDKIQD